MQIAFTTQLFNTKNFVFCIINHIFALTLYVCISLTNKYQNEKHSKNPFDGSACDATCRLQRLAASCL